MELLKLILTLSIFLTSGFLSWEAWSVYRLAKHARVYRNGNEVVAQFNLPGSVQIGPMVEGGDGGQGKPNLPVIRYKFDKDGNPVPPSAGGGGGGIRNVGGE